MKGFAAGLIGAGLLAGCSNPGHIDSTPPPRPSLVPVSSVVNAVKCELAETFRKRQDLYDQIAEDKDGADISAELVLSNVVTRAIEGEGGASVSFLGIGVEGTGGRSRTRSGEEAITLDFSYDLDRAATDPVDCSGLTDKVEVKGDPFIELLDGIARQNGELWRGAPKVKLGKLVYSSAFSVETETSHGATVTFLVFTLGGSRSVSRSSSQSLELGFGLNYVATLKDM